MICQSEIAFASPFDELIRPPTLEQPWDPADGPCPWGGPSSISNWGEEDLITLVESVMDSEPVWTWEQSMGYLQEWIDWANSLFP